MPKKRPVVVVEDEATGGDERSKRLPVDGLEALTAYALKMVLGGRSPGAGAVPPKRSGGAREN